MSSDRSVFSAIFSWTFFGGLFVGLVLGIAGLIGYARYDMAHADGEAAQKRDLDPPEVPPAAHRVTYGTVPDSWVLQPATRDDTTTFGAISDGPIVVNKWATWCVPCRAEMPTLEALHDSVGANVRLAVVSEEPRDRVRQYVESGSFSMPVYVVDEMPRALKGRGVPRTYVVRPNGQVVYRHRGAADWNADSVHRLLDRFRKEETG